MQWNFSFLTSWGRAKKCWYTGMSRYWKICIMHKLNANRNSWTQSDSLKNKMSSSVLYTQQGSKEQPVEQQWPARFTTWLVNFSSQWTFWSTKFKPSIWENSVMSSYWSTKWRLRLSDWQPQQQQLRSLLVTSNLNSTPRILSDSGEIQHELHGVSTS